MRREPSSRPPAALSRNRAGVRRADPSNAPARRAEPQCAPRPAPAVEPDRLRRPLVRARAECREPDPARDPRRGVGCGGHLGLSPPARAEPSGGGSRAGEGCGVPGRQTMRATGQLSHEIGGQLQLGMASAGLAKSWAAENLSAGSETWTRCSPGGRPAPSTTRTCCSRRSAGSVSRGSTRRAPATRGYGALVMAGA